MDQGLRTRLRRRRGLWDGGRDEDGGAAGLRRDRDAVSRDPSLLAQLLHPLLDLFAEDPLLGAGAHLFGNRLERRHRKTRRLAFRRVVLLVLFAGAVLVRESDRAEALLQVALDDELALDGGPD